MRLLQRRTPLPRKSKPSLRHWYRSVRPSLAAKPAGPNAASGFREDLHAAVYALLGLPPKTRLLHNRPCLSTSRGTTDGSTPTGGPSMSQQLPSLVTELSPGPGLRVEVQVLWLWHLH